MPRPKKLKRSRPDDYEDDGDVSDQRVKSSAKSSKKAKTAGAADSGKDDEGNSFWALGGTRRATVSSFKGKDFVNIREYYSDASGSLKPGKKGIMLTPEQYAKFLEAIPSINAELRGKGHELPDVSSAPAPAPAPPPVSAGEDEDEDEDEDAPKSPVKPKKVKPQPKKGKKANIEATSDEEEESD
ncbi:PC4-domain-containing protein [Hypoxylon rubiginosum]|uniref:PC4-domain-containing protein n=1 Tax=Hypoxylon rubiginosum TaxID=110542 RepID=A0ACB9Z7F7_9PEZI|nr:PC4-domain-containing protein [Hypoxylon rubiginosum]